MFISNIVFILIHPYILHFLVYMVELLFLFGSWMLWLVNSGIKVYGNYINVEHQRLTNELLALQIGEERLKCDLYEHKKSIWNNPDA